MARGRKPKPVELKEAEGNLGRRPLPAPIQTDPLDPQPPAGLGPSGRDLWTELYERLSLVGALDQLDRAGLTAACVQWDRACEAGRVVEEEGYFSKGSMGQVIPHPAIAIERAAHDRVVKFLTEYAATPVARARLAVAKARRDQQSEFEEITGAEPVEIDDGGEVDADAL